MNTLYVAEFIALATIHFLAVAAPGPDFAITVSQSIKYGRKYGIVTAIGIGAGISVHVLYTLLGVSVLVKTLPILLIFAKVLGATYLLYLSWKFVTTKKSSNLVIDSESSELTTTAKKAFSVGFFTNTTNPKATLFFLAIFTTIVSASTPISIQIFYGVWMCAVNTIWFIGVALFFSNQVIRTKFLELGLWFERTMGIIMALFAIKLIFTI